MIKEWVESKKWNPFNSFKLLIHKERWEKIVRDKEIPPPILVTIDPSYRCNLRCYYCNSKMTTNRNIELSKKAMINIVDLLSEWNGLNYKVEAACIAGGGEPLLNKNINFLIDSLLNKNIQIGVVTNGTLINKALTNLARITWTGVSVDAGTRKTFAAIKGEDQFFSVINNITKLTNYIKNNCCYHDSLGRGVSYKYLLCKQNMREIYSAAKLAKQIGCKNIHIRPMGISWYDLQHQTSDVFSADDVKLINNEIERTAELDDENFSVFGITHKFTPNFAPNNIFKKCYAIFMTAVLSPSLSNHDNFDVGLCCDRRGDSSLHLINNVDNKIKVVNAWGSKSHWNIFDKIAVNKCPRCTYQPHNEIFQFVIQNDNTTYKFI